MPRYEEKRKPSVHVTARAPAKLEFNDLSRSVIEVREWFKAEADEKGKACICPACEQTVKIRKRRLNSTLGKVLRYFLGWHATHPWEYVHMDKRLRELGEKPIRDYSIMAYPPWELIEPKPSDKNDGNPRSGYWRLTQRGVDFCHCKIQIPSAFFMFNSTSRGHSDETVSFVDVMRKKSRGDLGFDYREIIAEYPLPK